jgi:predicted nucleotidyltransferase
MINCNKNLIEKIAQEYNFDFIVLFGSFGTDSQRKTSDIDIAVKSDSKMDIEKYVKVQEAFAEAFAVQGEKIDIVETKHTSPLLAHQVAIKGRLLAGSQIDFGKFRLYALKNYFETKKFRDFTKRYIRQNLYAK